MSLPSSMADFVPCDRLLQKAYCFFKLEPFKRVFDIKHDKRRRNGTRKTSGMGLKRVKGDANLESVESDE